MSDANRDCPDQPHPVQIVSFEHDTGTGNCRSKVAFHMDLFKSILVKCGSSSPPVIISVIGPTQSGKSSFLNVAIRHLTRLTEGSPDALESITDTEPPVIEGFPHGKENRTSGILMWSEPFFYIKDGRKFAILLMDTQGLLLSTSKETALVLDICSLLSSVIIFNQDGGKLNEDLFLIFLQHFNYGSPILDQEPVFVIRDHISCPSPFGKQELETVVSNQFNLPPPSENGDANSPKVSSYMCRLQRAMNAISYERFPFQCWLFPLPLQTERFQPRPEPLQKDLHEVISESVEGLTLGYGPTPTELIFILEEYASLFNDVTALPPTNELVQTKLGEIGTHIYIETVKRWFEEDFEEEVQDSSYGFLEASSIKEFKLNFENTEASSPLPERIRKLCPGLDRQKVQEGIELVYQEALIENEAMEVKFVEDFVKTGYLLKIEKGMTELVEFTREALDKTPKPTADELDEMHEQFVEEFVTQFPEGGASASVIPRVRKIMMSRVRQIMPLASGSTNTPPEKSGEFYQFQQLYMTEMEKALFSKPNQFWLDEELNEKHLDSISHALSRSPQRFRTSYTPVVLNAPLLPTRRIYEERNSENTPVVGIVAEGRSWDALEFTSYSFVMNGKVKTYPIGSLIVNSGPQSTRSWRTLSALKVHLTQFLQPRNSMYTLKVILVVSVQAKLSMSMLDEDTLGNNFKSTGMQLLSVITAPTAAILFHLTDGGMLEKKVLNTVALLEGSDDDTVDIEIARVSESAVDVLGVLRVQTGCESSAKPRILSLLKDLGSAPPPLVLIVKAETCDEFDFNNFNEMQSWLVQHIGGVPYQGNRSLISKGAAVHGEMIRRRKGGLYSIFNPTPTNENSLDLLPSKPFPTGTLQNVPKRQGVAGDSTTGFYETQSEGEAGYSNMEEEKPFLILQEDGTPVSPEALGMDLAEIVPLQQQQSQKEAEQQQQHSLQDSENSSVSTSASCLNQGTKRPLSDSDASDSQSSDLGYSLSESSSPFRTRQRARKSTEGRTHGDKTKGPIRTASITSGKARRNEIPPNVKGLVPHTCNPSCVRRYDENSPTTRLRNPLSLPMYYGFERVKNRLCRNAFYRAPCGLRLRNYGELHDFLTSTQYNMGIDYFCFDDQLDCDRIFYPSSSNFILDDISDGQEKVPIQCCNSIDHAHPDVDYVKQRTFDDEILNDSNVPTILGNGKDFLVCCECEDDCADKEKCGCWKLTMEGYKNAGAEIPLEVGYQNRRLMERCITGIYECNSRCKCRKTCLNRVVQLGLKCHLQLFKTANKGWGVRPIHDIPAGAFICSYAGRILTNEGANQEGKASGDQYLTDLDFIEQCEEYKEGFEAALVEPAEPSRRRRRRKSMGVGKTSSRKLNVQSEHKKSLRKFFGAEDSCYVVDGKNHGNIGRYLNHSCQSNVFVQSVFVDSHDPRFPEIAFFASEYIRAGTELAWDYGYDVGSVPGKTIACKCGTPVCRGRLL